MENELVLNVLFGSVSSLLLAVVAYFIKQLHSDFKKMEKDITYPIDDVNDDYGFYFTYTFNEDGTGRYKSYYYYDNNKLDSNWSVEYTISNNQLLIYEEPEEGNPTSVYEIKELTKNKLVLLYKKVDDNDGYKAEITTTFKKI